MTLEKNIKKALDGDELANKIIYDKIYKVIYKSCSMFSTNKYDTEDKIQDCMIKIFDVLDLFYGKTDEDLGRWVNRIAINHNIDRHRKKKPNLTNRVEFVDPAFDDYNEEVKYEQEEMLEAIGKLSDKYQAIFNMFVLDGYSHREISKILNMPDDSSKAIFYLAKNKLKRILEKK